MNCSAPDTGNMEVLERVGTPEQKERWLKPLLNGEIRSAYAMTEPHARRRTPRTSATSAVLEGDEWVINGEKYYISGAGDPRCKIMITMVKTSPDAPPHKQQSQILVPMDTPGVEDPRPHARVRRRRRAARPHAHPLHNVRVPKEQHAAG
jgi:acyl-CoA dehydrogenase